MQVIYGLKQVRKFRKPVVALGVFDGVHSGHRKILKSAVAFARRIKGSSVVLTFWPHPQKKESLYSLEHRLRLIGEQGVDVCIVVDFNKRFASIPAGDFVKDILFAKINARYVYVGKNFRFGKNATGDFKILNKLSKACNFKLKTFEVITKNNLPISSTHIRELIKKGDLGNAEKLLSHPVSILGTVIKGSSLGSRLGFPTANINPHHEVIPPDGVYAVKVIFDNKEFGGACYIGWRPTFRQWKIYSGLRAQRSIEVHIFNFNKNIYGKYLEIRFIKKIREEKKFVNPSFLAAQIKKDLLNIQK